MTESSSSQARQMPQTPHTPQGAGCNLFSLTIDTNTKIVRGGDGKLIDLAKLEKVASPELYFHGSRSASLLLFSNLGDNTYHQLLPMGEMIDKGVAYYSGEGGAYGVGNSVMPNAFNKKYVSVTNAQNFGSAYNHVINDSPAWHPDGFKQSREATDKLKLHDAQIITDFHQLQQRRNAQWDEMNDKQKSLVLSNFPVIYAIDTGEVELAYTDSSVNGEKGFPGGIPPDQISMLFVPDKNVDDTVEFFQQTELFRQMKVKGFSSFYKDP